MTKLDHVVSDRLGLQDADTAPIAPGESATPERAQPSGTN